MREAIATLKGCALLAAIKTGLLPEVDGGYDTAPFEKFWEKFLEFVERSENARKKYGNDRADGGADDSADSGKKKVSPKRPLFGKRFR